MRMQIKIDKSYVNNGFLIIENHGPLELAKQAPNYFINIAHTNQEIYYYLFCLNVIDATQISEEKNKARITASEANSIDLTKDTQTTLNSISIEIETLDFENFEFKKIFTIDLKDWIKSNVVDYYLQQRDSFNPLLIINILKFYDSLNVNELQYQGAPPTAEEEFKLIGVDRKYSDISEGFVIYKYRGKLTTATDAVDVKKLLGRTTNSYIGMSCIYLGDSQTGEYYFALPRRAITPQQIQFYQSNGTISQDVVINQNMLDDTQADLDEVFQRYSAVKGFDFDQETRGIKTIGNEVAIHIGENSTSDTHSILRITSAQLVSFLRILPDKLAYLSTQIEMKVNEIVEFAKIRGNKTKVIGKMLTLKIENELIQQDTATDELAFFFTKETGVHCSVKNNDKNRLHEIRFFCTLGNFTALERYILDARQKQPQDTQTMINSLANGVNDAEEWWKEIYKKGPITTPLLVNSFTREMSSNVATTNKPPEAPQEQPDRKRQRRLEM